MGYQRYPTWYEALASNAGQRCSMYDDAVLVDAKVLRFHCGELTPTDHKFRLVQRTLPWLCALAYAARESSCTSFVRRSMPKGSEMTDVIWWQISLSRPGRPPANRCITGTNRSSNSASAILPYCTHETPPHGAKIVRECRLARRVG